ncbi:MAG: Rieske 2Fe-2S domain-containing protein [Chloroflexi bacterium]|nr:Rieske 2Fe-2S domain-containing protein [Chloroflexota bacterium]
MRSQGKLVNTEAGLVSRRIFADQEIYRLEMERIFHRCWLFLGHESMIPRPGDYITNYMGEDPVIVWRDARGSARAFLNTCPHRGNKVCLYDVGRAAALTCSYHGWTFNSEGALVGVPSFEEAYYGQLDRTRWGLVEVPKVVTYGGFIFGNWDAGAISLEEYLGEFRWYFDNLIIHEEMGGLEVIPGCQRYSIVGNWKLFCDNFSGDHYHTPSTHASASRVGVGGGEARETGQGKYGYFEVALAPAHGLGGIFTDGSQYRRDLARAEELGPEVLAYVTERQRRLEERIKEIPAKPYGFSHGNCFPNLDMVGFSSALIDHDFLLCHPKGRDASEIWQWTFIERAAPDIVKDLAARSASRGQAPAGLFGQDDCENFERITENTLTPMADKLTFHYAMSVGYDGEWPGHEEWHTQGLPGLVGPQNWETSQRRYYAYWAQLMGMEA